ncbi:MAG TPA: TRAP transporter small permease subunit [Bacillales bacterium]|nr:TRAP transporter small permease subunit [Bacillales bacterium]
MTYIMRLEKWLTTFCLLGAVALGIVQIIARYVFSTGWPWGNGIVVMLAVWGSLFAGAAAIESREHISIDIVMKAFPISWQSKINLIANLLTTLFVGTLCYFSIHYFFFLVEFGGTSLLTYLPAWVEFIGIPVSTFFMTIHGFRNVVSLIRGG